MKKAPKGNCHGYSMVNDPLPSDCKVVSEEAKKMVMDDKRQEWNEKNKDWSQQRLRRRR